MSTSETYVTVTSKHHGRHGALISPRSKCLDHVEQDAHQRYSRAVDGDDDDCESAGSAGMQVAGGRRRRQRSTGGRRRSRRQQQRPEVTASPSRRVDVGGDDDDDAGSVCSGASSASENSTASRGSGGGRTGRRSRGPPRSTRPSGAGHGGSGDTSRQTADCKCQSDGRVRLTGGAPPARDVTDSGSRCGVERPEPEGGVRAAPYKSVMSDEFDRLIYGPSEPLFSDGEDSLPGTLDNDVDVTKDCTTSTSVRAAAAQPQRRRCTGAAVDVDESTDNLFSAAQMINSNNLMKFAIIQMELKNVKDVSLRRVCQSRLLLLLLCSPQIFIGFLYVPYQVLSRRC